MALPQFLCIGAQKAATSWLYVNLQRHHQIWMPPVKELHYFNHLFVPENRSWTNYHIRTNTSSAVRHHIKNGDYVDFGYLRYLCGLMTDPFTETWYRNAYDRPNAKGKVLGDITPEYSTIPEQGIDYVRSLLGAPRLIYIIRDPVARAMSQLRMALERQPRDNMQESDWRAMVEDWDVNNRGDYATFIPRWRSRFADQDFLFLPFAKVNQDPHGVMRQVEIFLGVDPAKSYDGTEEKVHKTKSAPIPAFVQDMLQDRFKGQYSFLEKEFGKDFVSQL